MNLPNQRPSPGFRIVAFIENKDLCNLALDCPDSQNSDARPQEALRYMGVLNDLLTAMKKAGIPSIKTFHAGHMRIYDAPRHVVEELIHDYLEGSISKLGTEAKNLNRNPWARFFVHWMALYIHTFNKQYIMASYLCMQHYKERTDRRFEMQKADELAKAKRNKRPPDDAFTVRKPSPEEARAAAQLKMLREMTRHISEIATDALTSLQESIDTIRRPDMDMLECRLEELPQPPHTKDKAALEEDERRRKQEELLEDSDWLDDDDLEQHKKANKRRKDENRACEFCDGTGTLYGKVCFCSL